MKKLSCNPEQVTAKVSIIVPVYNVADYIRECIESIIKQTLKEIEIILVDDGSTDDSSRICDIYAVMDNRIKVIHKKTNEGLSSARNDGLKNASAPYIMFIDGDDYVEPEFCELPYRTAIENNADLVIFSFKKKQQDGRILNVKTGLKSGIICEEDALNFNVLVAPAVWLGLYQKELFNDIKFPDSKYHEDTGTTYRLIHAARRIFFVEKEVYYYRIGRQGSIITTPETRDHPDRKEMVLRRINDLYSWGFIRLTWNDTLYLLTRYGCRGDKQKQLVNIASRIKGYPADFSIKKRILLFIFRLSPVLFDAICIVTRRQKTK